MREELVSLMNETGLLIAMQKRLYWSTSWRTERATAFLTIPIYTNQQQKEAIMENVVSVKIDPAEAQAFQPNKIPSMFHVKTATSKRWKRVYATKGKLFFSEKGKRVPVDADKLVEMI